MSLMHLVGLTVLIVIACLVAAVWMVEKMAEHILNHFDHPDDEDY